MPTIGTVLPYVRETATEISQIPGATSVHVFGSFAHSIDNKRARVRDIDLLVKCEFHSGDLLAIDQTPEGPLKIAQEELEDMGFNPLAVAFTKKYLKHGQRNIDQWAASSDNRLLHWGPIAETVTEWQGLRTEAENTALKLTGLTRKTICKASENNREKWLEAYNSHLFEFIRGGPVGWYASESSLDEIMEQSIKLASR